MWSLKVVAIVTSHLISDFTHFPSFKLTRSGSRQETLARSMTDFNDKIVFLEFCCLDAKVSIEPPIPCCNSNFIWHQTKLGFPHVMLSSHSQRVLHNTRNRDQIMRIFSRVSFDDNCSWFDYANHLTKGQEISVSLSSRFLLGLIPTMFYSLVKVWARDPCSMFSKPFISRAA